MNEKVYPFGYVPELNLCEYVKQVKTDFALLNTLIEELGEDRINAMESKDSLAVAFAIAKLRTSAERAIQYMNLDAGEVFSYMITEYRKKRFL